MVVMVQKRVHFRRIVAQNNQGMILLPTSSIIPRSFCLLSPTLTHKTSEAQTLNICHFYTFDTIKIMAVLSNICYIL